MQGPVLKPFTYDETHPYAAGQHRGVDLGAEAAGDAVVAPAAGTVSFAGTVPTNGKSVTIETADGYSVTLTHLGSIGVAEGVTVAEQDAVGTVGPSGTPEVDGPYVHLGIRLTADPKGYVDPLGLLPPASDPAATETGTTASQPASSGGSSAAPAPKAASPPKSTRVATTRRTRPESARSHVRTRQQERVQKPRSNARASRSHHRPALRDRASEQTGSLLRPVVEPVAPRPIGLDAGHAIRPTVVATVAPLRSQTPTVLIPALCNVMPALFAFAAALAAARTRRRRRTEVTPGAAVQVVGLPPPAGEHRRVSRAA